MAALYFYAITDHPERRLGLGAGLADAQLESIAYRDIAAIVSPLAGGVALPNAANVLLHERVIEALMAERTALPARFGMILNGPQAALDALAGRYSAYVANLERVRGRVELGLRVLWRAPAPLEPALTRDRHIDGRSYLAARLAEERRAQAEQRAAEELAAAIAQRLAALAVDHVAEVLVTPRMLLKAAYLIERAQIGAFSAAVNQSQASDPALRFLCTGPWPAYHFVTATN